MSELYSDFIVEKPAPVQQAGLTAGRMLREAREAKGLTADSLAASMKVSTKKIEAIETDCFELLPDMVFARALALSICRHLRIDADQILKQFPPSIAHNLKSDESGINTPFRPSQDMTKLMFVNVLTRPAAVIFILVLLAALLLFVFPVIYTSKSGVSPAEVAQINLPPAIDEKVAPHSASPLVGASEALLAPALISVAPVVNEGTSVAGLGGSGGQIVFKSRGVTWVEVIDAKGTVQLRKTLAAGEVAGASGAVPLMVVVGKADAVDVSVAGKPFNLIAVAKDNIARFEVN
jgi:cytoskeleton protein RodZ